MPRYQYKVVPAPTKGVKAKGVKGAEARFSHAIEELMNSLAAEGWEYQRAETLPSTERSGLAGSTTEWRNVFVFRRLRENDAEAFKPELLPPPESPTDSTATMPKAPAAVRPLDATQTSRDLPKLDGARSAETSSAQSDPNIDVAKDKRSISATFKRFSADRKPTNTTD